jgi:hypothetical protein
LVVGGANSSISRDSGLAMAGKGLVVKSLAEIGFVGFLARIYLSFKKASIKAWKE